MNVQNKEKQVHSLMVLMLIIGIWMKQKNKVGH